MMNQLLMLLFILFTTSTSNVGSLPVSSSLPEYELRAEIDHEEGYLEVQLTLTAPVHLLESGNLEFLFSPDADVTSITGENLISYDVNNSDPGPANYVLTFGEISEPTVSFDMSYNLLIPADHQMNRINTEWIELNLDSFWHPVLSNFSRFHYRLDLGLDSAYNILTGDYLKLNSDSTYNYTIESAIPRIDISFSAAKQFYSVEGDFVKIYSTRPSEDLDSLLIIAEKAMSFLYNYIDKPEDFEHKRIVVESPREEVGYSRDNYIVLSSLQAMDTRSISSYLAHEFSHYWFSSADPLSPNHWLNESFAEFMAMIFIRDSYGESYYLKDLKNKRERIKNYNVPMASYQTRPSHLALYYKGPLVLHEFENRLGQDSFQSLIQILINHRVATNREMNEVIRAHFGINNERILKDLLKTM